MLYTTTDTHTSQVLCDGSDADHARRGCQCPDLSPAPTTHAPTTHAAHHVPHIDRTPDESTKTTRDASRKLRIHVTCILVAGTVSTILVLMHIGSPALLGYGPAAPSIAQEIFDRLFRL